MPSSPVWEYEPDESPKRKHYWNHDDADFLRVGNNRVGKCPTSISHQEAASLLLEAVPWCPKGWRRDYPQRLYAVRDGILYRATPTNPGRSYHGFPEHHDLFPKGANALKESLLERAQLAGFETQLKRWMNW